LIPFPDPKDKKLRAFPQALFKQMDLPEEHPQMGPYDILAMFNSNVTYWFVGDPEPLSEKQIDMLYVVLHELVHGLGMASAWNDYAQIKALTPLFAISDPISKKGMFIELVTDRLLELLPEGKQLTSFADELNKFEFTADMSDDQIIKAFVDSPQFKIAQDLFKKATTANTMGWLYSDLKPNTKLNKNQINNDIAISETSLNPHSPGSSVSHLDLKTYVNTSDFLMIFRYPRTKTIAERMKNADSTDEFGPMGPKLRAILKAIG
jgi:hypothetical protein